MGTLEASRDRGTRQKSSSAVHVPGPTAKQGVWLTMTDLGAWAAMTDPGTLAAMPEQEA